MYNEICEGDNYRGWSEPGEYKEVIESDEGCEGMVTTHLSVFPMYDTIIKVDICEGESYKGWTSTGIYTEKLISVDGCDSTIQTNLTVNKEYDITQEVNICEGESYNGWTEEGLYLWEGVTNNGCDSSVTVILTVSACVNDIKNSLNDDVTIFPNPNDGKFSLTLGHNFDHVYVEIYDIIGVKRYEKEFMHPERELEMNIGMMPKGLYMMNISIGKIRTQIGFVINY